jgi:hypothetical protein
LDDLGRFERFDFPFGRRAKPSREATPKKKEKQENNKYKTYFIN